MEFDLFMEMIDTIYDFFQNSNYKTLIIKKNEDETTGYTTEYK